MRFVFTQSVAAEWSPLAAARAQLASEKPGVVQRVDMIVEQCRIAQENRNYRLNSLGACIHGDAQRHMKSAASSVLGCHAPF